MNSERVWNSLTLSELDLHITLIEKSILSLI